MRSGVASNVGLQANGVHCGRHLGYLEPVEIELTRAMTAAPMVLAVAVNSSWDRTVDPLWGSGSLWNYGGVGRGKAGGDGYSFGGYGGIVGHAKVLVRGRAWFEDSVVVASTSSSPEAPGDWSVTVQFAVIGVVAATDTATVSICSWNEPALGCVTASTAGPLTSGSRVGITVTVQDARLWVPGTRAAQAELYTANLTLLPAAAGASTGVAIKSIRFGIYSIDTEGPRIKFNGESLFLRGYGDDGMLGSCHAFASQVSPHSSAPHCRAHAVCIPNLAIDHLTPVGLLDAGIGAWNPMV